jgi:hypothetical protein
MIVSITLTFGFQSGSLNSSLQVGDTAYYTNPTDVAEFDVNNSMVEIGTTPPPTDGTGGTPQSYIFFSKDNKVNSTSMLGYFSKAKFKNNSTDRAEIFATACEVFESSK